MKINDWIKSRDGKRIDVDGFPNHNAYQCWDLWSDYAQKVIGLPQVQTVTYAGVDEPHRGYACNVHHGGHQAGLLDHFDAIPAGKPAQLGDVAFWEKGTRYPGSHVAIVIEDHGDTLLTLSQNPGAAQRVELPKIDLLGYFRPKADVGQGTPAASTPAPAPTQKSYTVQKGDTLGEIAQRFGTTVAQLAELNKIADPDVIKTGQRLNLVGKAASAPQPAPNRMPRIRDRIKLATPWVRFRHSNLTGRMRSNLPAGTYPVVGISNGNYRLRGNGYDGWVHSSARAGLQ